MGLTSPKPKVGAKSRVSGRTPVSGEHDVDDGCDSEEEVARRLELAIGRPWTLKDTERVFGPMDKELSKVLSREQMYYFFDMVADPEHEHLWGRAIRKDIDYLRAKGLLVDDPESMALDIRSEVQRYDLVLHCQDWESDRDTGLSASEEAESSGRKRIRASEVADEMCGVCFQALGNQLNAVFSLGCEHMKEKKFFPLCKRTVV